MSDDKLCACCGNREGCDCYSPQSGQGRRLAIAQARIHELEESLAAHNMLGPTMVEMGDRIEALEKVAEAAGLLSAKLVVVHNDPLLGVASPSKRGRRGKMAQRCSRCGKTEKQHGGKACVGMSGLREAMALREAPAMPPDERALKAAREFHGHQNWPLSCSPKKGCVACQRLAMVVLAQCAEAVAAARPGIEREGANRRTRDIAFKIQNCLTPTGAGKWGRADSILRLAYPDAFEAEIARLKGEPNAGS